jgi:LacI family transcriptional regulator
MSSSIREIARLTGLSTATVSLALRGKGRMSEDTRKKICAAAEKAGYQSHPLLSQAFCMVRQPSAQRYRETLAFIAEWETRTGPEHQKDIYAAALEKASQLGYKLETFLVSGKPAEHRSLSRILRARGIRGLIVIPRLGNAQPRLHLEWKHFAAVEIGRTLAYPRNLHHVETGNFSRVVAALHLLKRMGYRRIGMAIEPMQNHHEGGTYYAAFLLSQLRQPLKNRIPILAPLGPWNEKNFRAWMIRHKPDVLYIHAAIAPTYCQWLENLGLSVPEDVSLFCSNVQDGEWTGVRRDYPGMGRSAVEMVSLLLQNNEYGLSENPRCWQVDEFWQPGKTMSQSMEGFISSEAVPG